MNDLIVTIDPLGAHVDRLGPATPEQRAEVKAARKAEQRKSIKELAAAYFVMALVAGFFMLGTVVGNVTDGDVRDISLPWPSEKHVDPHAVPEHVPGLTLEREK